MALGKNEITIVLIGRKEKYIGKYKVRSTSGGRNGHYLPVAVAKDGEIYVDANKEHHGTPVFEAVTCITVLESDRIVENIRSIPGD